MHSNLCEHKPGIYEESGQTHAKAFSSRFWFGCDCLTACLSVWPKLLKSGRGSLVAQESERVPKPNRSIVATQLKTKKECLGHGAYDLPGMDSSFLFSSRKPSG